MHFINFKSQVLQQIIVMSQTFHCMTSYFAYVVSQLFQARPGPEIGNET